MYDKQKSRMLEIIYSQARQNRELTNTIQKLIEENNKLQNEITMLGRDSLTGLYNRNIAGEAHLKTSTVIMCDIDDFKKLNDTYGHNFGDTILKKIASILSSSIKATDYPVRWGGEEFILFIDDRRIEIAEAIAERIRMKTESLKGEILEDGSICPCITMSFGVSMLHGGQSLKDDIEKVDQALYDSKRKGKNAVTVYNENTFSNNKCLVKRK